MRSIDRQELNPRVTASLCIYYQSKTGACLAEIDPEHDLPAPKFSRVPIGEGFVRCGITSFAGLDRGTANDVADRYADRQERNCIDGYEPSNPKLYEILFRRQIEARTSE